MGNSWSKSQSYILSEIRGSKARPFQEQRLSKPFVTISRLNEKKARLFLFKEQKARQGFIKKYFYEDIDNPYLYDFIINTDRVPTEEAAKMIGKFVLEGGCRSVNKDEEEV